MVNFNEFIKINTSGMVIAEEKEESKIKLDSKDREIIGILSRNSRTSLTQIARAIQVSPEVVNYRYNRLRNKKIITDTFAVVNLRALGVTRFCIYLQLKAASREKTWEIVKRFINDESVSWVIETSGKWDVILMVEMLDEEKFTSIRERLFAPIQKNLNDIMIVYVWEFVHRGPRYLENIEDKKFVGIEKFSPYVKEFNTSIKTKINLNVTDIKILVLLHRDARIPAAEIGAIVGLSRDAVDYRIKSLIRSGFIRGFIIRLNYHLLGFQYATIMFKLHSTSNKKRQEFLYRIQQDYRFYCLMEQIGAWDISLMMYFSNTRDLRSFLMQIKEEYSTLIHSYETASHFNQYVYTYLCNGVIKELLQRYK